MSTTRFAPSPTGWLHLGHAYAAAVARHCARRSNGIFLLRFEDIDLTRIRPAYYEAARDDLLWLGLAWDRETLPQLDRSDRHGAVLDELRVLGVLYPCFCTRREVEEEITTMAAAPQGPEGPHYPGTCRKLSPAERDRRLQAAIQPAWRLDSAAAAKRIGRTRFDDLRHGRIEVNPMLLGDVVLGRKDIGNSYHLAVVIDDADDGVSLVTRGEDLLPATHIHRTLQVLLGLPAPCYLHHELVTDESGKRLAKRDDARSIHHYREAGLSPAEVFSMLPPLPV